MTQKILEGFKVIDFTHVVAGPHCTKMLAEQGAEVIKIEPIGGELSRQLPNQKDGRSAYFIQHNIGKKTMCMDISTPEGQEICHQLIKDADVVVENFSPGVMKKHNLDWDTLKEINPDLVMCSISCFGQTGPLSHLPGYDWIGQSYAGIIDMTGDPDDIPVFGEYAFGDASTGAHAYGAIVSALLHRLRGGRGQHIDLSLIEVLFSYHELHVQLYDTSKGEFQPKRAGRYHTLLAPVGIYRCKDRFIFILGLAHQWEGLVKAMGREDMLEDPRLNDLNTRGQYRDEITEAVEAWLDSVGDVHQAVALLQEYRVPCAPILSIPEVMDLPHCKERGVVRTVTDPVWGELRIPRTPLRFSDFPEVPDAEAGMLGQHNHEILGNYLNYSEDQIASLEGKGIIESKNI